VEVFWTVFTGTCVYVLGQLLSKAFLEPLTALWLTLRRIYDALMIHKPVYMGR
jgi:hypothetical protein